MGRNLVVCCDGTGNVWGPGAGTTNVVRLARATLRDPRHQILYYDPGVGTPDGFLSDGALRWKDTLRRVFGLALGDGVWTNVAEAYQFLAEHYRDGDRIFLFGFSRGAFTARAVGGLIHLCGLVEPQHRNLVPALLKVYRSKAGPERDAAGASLRERFARPEVRVHFTGVWDTVESVGVFDTLVGAHITSNKDMKSTYVHVRHAVALDEQRAPYLPRLYEPPPALPAGSSFKQVWFAGAHSDVGGGYREAGLSNAALHWMVREANACGLAIDPAALDDCGVDPTAMLHDEPARRPAWVVLGLFARDRPPGPFVVHESVVERIDASEGRYRPRLPAGHGIERTAATVFVDGVPVERPVPRAPPVSPPRRTTVSARAVAAAALAALLVVALLVGLPAERPAWTALAERQIGIGREDFWRLGASLLALCGDAPVGTRGLCVPPLLGWDLLLIAGYAVALPTLLLLVLRFADRDGAVPKTPGRMARAAAVLPLADLVENAATWQAAQAAAEVEALHGWTDPVWTVVATAAAAAKSGAVVVLVLLVAVALVARAGGSARQRPAAPTDARSGGPRRTRRGRRARTRRAAKAGAVGSASRPLRRRTR